VLLGILAFAFQHIIQERSREQSTRNALLSTATTNAVQYLLPISTAVEGLRSHTKDSVDRGFFYFVFALKRMRDLSSSGGGFFFEDTRSKELPNQCWSVVFGRLVKGFGYVDLSYAMDLMEKRETVSKFLRLLEPPKGVPNEAQLALMRVHECFMAWSKDIASDLDLGLLGIMSEVIQFEANRLYLGWYKEVPSPSLETLHGWQGAIVAFAAVDSARAKGLLEKLDSYVKTLPWPVRSRFWEIKVQIPSSSA
jgi:hypothetical protein